MAGYVGIDYGLGRTNRDEKTGIRYGVISQGTVGQVWYDEAEADYGEPTCPQCGNDAKSYAESVAEKYESARHECADYMCESCESVFGSESAFSDEAIGWNYDSDGYRLVDCLDSDIMILESEFYTFAQFCSPCVPGAGNLDNAIDGGVKTFCLSHDWFEDGKAPYRVFRVSDDSEVFP